MNSGVHHLPSCGPSVRHSVWGLSRAKFISSEDDFAASYRFLRPEPIKNLKLCDPGGLGCWYNTLLKFCVASACVGGSFIPPRPIVILVLGKLSPLSTFIAGSEPHPAADKLGNHIGHLTNDLINSVTQRLSWNE